MAFNFYHLNELTRKTMLEEVQSDIKKDNLYPSKRFNETGINNYPAILCHHVQHGTEVSLGEALRKQDCFKTHEQRNTRGKITLVKVPETAHLTFAEGEFNRFYIRSLCVEALLRKVDLIVYRARTSENPRSESEALIGSLIDPKKVLVDLRSNIGVDTVLGLPMGPNSGLSVRFAEAGISLYQ